ncbi:uncharacterized protein [Nicotiana tomentosiformis]|uniref:uncharacterized protein n=1 Tax=Nicotiana tomentosiformis TaxID=4098 RepID=UPI00388CBB42
MQEEEIPNNVVPPNDEVQIEIDDIMEETQEEVNPSKEHIIDIPEPVVQKAEAPLPKPPPPYTQILSKQNGENQFKKFIQMMKNLSINIPLVEALEQMPRYAKFMKDLVTKKWSINFETIKVTHQVSAIVHSMAPKLEDPDYEVDYKVSIILGRPFFATGKALCDVEAGELTFRIGDENVVFHACKSMRQPNSNEVCYFVDLVTDVNVDEKSATINVGDMLEAVLLNFDDDEVDGSMECVNSLQGIGSYNYAPQKLSLDIKNRTNPPIKPSIEEPPTLDLKPLPPHLRYEFFGRFHIGVATKEEEGCGWILEDIQGISPAFCMHNIKLEDGAKPSIEHQRGLNEAIQEVVKKDTGIVLGHKISRNGIEADKENIEVISKLPPPTSVKGVRSFLGHAGFYQHFIKDFSKVVNPLCKLLEKDAKFYFNDDCMRAFELLKLKMTTTPIITAPN